jgi:hypothetical protein
MTRLTPLKRLGLALATAGALSLAACGQAPSDTAKQAAEQAGEAAKDAATATGQAALAPAVQPVLDLLTKSEGDIKAGSLGGALAAMGGFKAVWDKAAPVIQPSRTISTAPPGIDSSPGSKTRRTMPGTDSISVRARRTSPAPSTMA